MIQLDSQELRKLKPIEPLRIIEKDLTVIPAIRSKSEFDPEDLRIDYSNERLAKNEIEIPIFKNPFIRPFHFKGKFIRYELQNHGGGFYHFKFLNGKIVPKQKDRRYPEEQIDRKNGGEMEFWICYDAEEKKYFKVDTIQTFNEHYSVITNSLSSEYVSKLLTDFEDFVNSFLSREYTSNYEKLFRGTGSMKLRYYYQILSDLKNNFDMLFKYHELLNIMDDIDDFTFLHIKKSFTNYQEDVHKFILHMETNLDLDTELKDLNSLYEIYRPIENFLAQVQTEFWVRGYFINPERKVAFPNFLEIHYQRQLSAPDHFESTETLREREKEILQDHLKKAIKAGKIVFVTT